MLRRRFFLMGAILAGIAMAGLAPPARAEFQLYVQEFTASGATVGSAVVFNGSEPGSGLGLILGASGSTPNFAFSFNASENANVSGAAPSLHLDSFNIGLNTATTDYLAVAVTEGGSGNGYTFPGPSIVEANLSSISGIGNALVTLQAFADTNNNAYGVPSGTVIPNPPNTTGSNPFAPPLVSSAGAVATPTISMTSSNSGAGITTFTGFNASGPFSMTQVVTVSGLSLFQTISFNSTESVAPAPAGLALAFCGMPVLGLYYLRRRKALSPA